jgi:hypothetical protein
MNVMCAWCEKEGKTVVIGTKEGPADQVTHGICKYHQDEMLQQIAALQQRLPAANPRRRRR